jgi:AmmeMemoRadiSam system protein B
VSPHAGYIYSGSTAGELFASVEPREICIVIGPNHTGYGKPFSISPDEAWETPLGTVPVNRDVSNALLKHSGLLEYDSLSHAYEHSLEVQLPFLQISRKPFSLVGLVIAHHDDIAPYLEIGANIADTAQELGIEKKVLIVASSDMTHYEPENEAQEKDSRAIEALLRLDEKELFDVIQRYDISMCGYAPAIIMLTAAKRLGATKAHLVKYTTSAEASGDRSSVVGYAGILVN